MKKIIRKILKEDRRQMFLDKIVHVMNNDFPLIKNLREYGFYEQLSEEELNYVLSGIFGKPVRYSDDRIGILLIYDEYENEIYSEDSDGYWWKKEYDKNGNRIYYEDSDGDWVKYEFDEYGYEIYFEYSDGSWIKYEYDKGNKIYFERSNGYWEKREYDDRGREIYHEDSDGYWEKREYDDRGREIYHEDSDGYIYDNR